MTYQELGSLWKAYRKAIRSYSYAVKTGHMTTASQIWESMQTLEDKITQLEHQIRHTP